MKIGHTKENVNVAVMNMLGSFETSYYSLSLVSMKDNGQVTDARGVPAS